MFVDSGDQIGDGKTMSDTNECDDSKRTGVNWNDPAVAMGNAPPMPGWPLVVSILAWLGGILFLLVMMVERLR